MSLLRIIRQKSWAAKWLYHVTQYNLGGLTSLYAALPSDCTLTNGRFFLTLSPLYSTTLTLFLS